MAHSPAMGAAAPATPATADVEGTAISIALLGRGALTEIAALCSVALAALETNNACGGEDLALLLTVIEQKAQDIANCIDAEAEQINIKVGCHRAAKRRAARAARTAELAALGVRA